MHISKKIWILLFFVCLFSMNAQDTIFKLNNEKINAKIVEVAADENVLKYKLTSNPDGPLYVISTKKISKIVYSNGVSESFQLNTGLANTTNALSDSSSALATIYLFSGEQKAVYIISKDESNRVLRYTLTQNSASLVRIMDLNTIEKIIYENGKVEFIEKEKIKIKEDPFINDSAANYVSMDIIAPIGYKLFSIAYERILKGGEKGLKFIFSTNPVSSPYFAYGRFPKRIDTRYALGVDLNLYLNNALRSRQNFFFGPAIEVGSFIFSDQSFMLTSKDTMYNYQYPSLKDTVYSYAIDTKLKTTYKIIFAAKCGILFKMGKHFFGSSQLTLGICHVGNKYKESTMYYGYYGYNEAKLTYHTTPSTNFVQPEPEGYKRTSTIGVKMNFEINFGFKF